MAVVQCRKCGNWISDNAPKCFDCGHPTAKAHERAQEAASDTPKVSLPWWNRAVGKPVLVFGAILLVVGPAMVLPFVHIVYGGARSTVVTWKTSVSLSETFVAWDEILDVPYIAAVSKYPLTVKALQRDGYIETNDQRQRRIEREVEAASQKAREEIEREMRRWK